MEDLIKKKARDKKWHHDHRLEINERQRKYYVDHRRERLEQCKLYVENNREKVRASQKKWSDANRLYRRETERNRNREIKKEIMAHYGGKCECCGEDRIEFLSIDHVNGGGNKHRKELGNVSFYGWLRKQSFPGGYRVLCMNCNFSIGAYGHCPHEKERDVR